MNEDAANLHVLGGGHATDRTNQLAELYAMKFMPGDWKWYFLKAPITAPGETAECSRFTLHCAAEEPVTAEFTVALDEGDVLDDTLVATIDAPFKLVAVSMPCNSPRIIKLRRVEDDSPTPVFVFEVSGLWRSTASDTFRAFPLEPTAFSYE